MKDLKDVIELSGPEAKYAIIERLGMKCDGDKSKVEQAAREILEEMEENNVIK